MWFNVYWYQYVGYHQIGFMAWWIMRLPRKQEVPVLIPLWTIIAKQKWSLKWRCPSICLSICVNNIVKLLHLSQLWETYLMITLSSFTCIYTLMNNYPLPPVTIVFDLDFWHLQFQGQIQIYIRSIVGKTFDDNSDFTCLHALMSTIHSWLRSLSLTLTFNIPVSRSNANFSLGPFTLQYLLQLFQTSQAYRPWWALHCNPCLWPSTFLISRSNANLRLCP